MMSKNLVCVFPVLRLSIQSRIGQVLVWLNFCNFEDSGSLEYDALLLGACFPTFRSLVPALRGSRASRRIQPLMLEALRSLQNVGKHRCSKTALLFKTKRLWKLETSRCQSNRHMAGVEVTRLIVLLKLLICLNMLLQLLKYKVVTVQHTFTRSVVLHEFQIAGNLSVL